MHTAGPGRYRLAFTLFVLIGCCCALRGWCADDPRLSVALDGDAWELRPFAFGEGERAGIQLQGTRIEGSKPVTVPNDVQLSSFVDDPLGQSAQLVQVNQKEWWYTRHFKGPDLQPGRRATLIFDGVDYFAEVWLNGAKLGAHEGAYTRFSLDVTNQLAPQGDNYLAVKVTAPWKVPGRSHYEFMKGEFDEWWDALPGPGMVVYPLGLHRSVHLEVSPDVRVDAINVSTVRIEGDTAELKLNVDVATLAGATQGVLQVSLTPENFAGDSLRLPARNISLGGGAPEHQSIQFDVKVPHAQLWWTWDLGRQNLYRAEAHIAAADGSLRDRATTTFGIRTLSRDANMQYRLNGRPIFFRGAWYAMSKLYPASTDRWTYEKDLRLARNANMNHLVNYTVIEKEDFYELADRLGIMLFMELPFNQEGPIDALNAAYPRRAQFIQWASSESAQIVRALSNHPSVGVWAAVSEVTENSSDFKVSWDPRVEQAADGYALFVKAMQQVVEENDPDSLYFRSYCDFGEHHFWEGTFFPGTTYDQHFDASAGFISEYGAQAFFPPEDVARVVDLGKYWQPENARWSPVRLPLQLKAFSYLQPWQSVGLDFFTADIAANVSTDISSVRDYINASSLYQAFIYGYAGDAYRRKLFAPVNGVRSWMFKSFTEVPVGGFGVIDPFHHATPAYYEQKRTFAAVTLSFARRLPLESVPAGSLLEAPVWISNAASEPLAASQVHVALYDLGGKVLQQQTIPASVAADHAQAVADLQWQLPRDPGIYVLRANARKDGRVIATASSYVKVVPPASGKRVLVVGSPEWAEPVAGYLTALGAKVTTLLASYTVVRPMQLPASASQLRNDFDVIWLAGYDNYWREAPEGLSQLIADAVRSGVTFVHSGSPASFHGSGEKTAALDLTPLSDLLPVEVAHENDIFVKASYRVGEEPNVLASTVEHRLQVTDGAPEWLRKVDLTGPAPEGFHMLQARNDRDVLIRIDEIPLLVRGRFGSGATFAYLGFSPEGSIDGHDRPVILDRLIRGSAQARLFATMCAAILQLDSREPPSVSVSDILDSRSTPLYQTLARLPAAAAPRISTSWTHNSSGELVGHVRLVNGEGYAFGLRVRIAGQADHDGRTLQLWSNQYFDLLPHETAEADVTVLTADGKPPGPMTLVVENLKEALREIPVNFGSTR